MWKALALLFFFVLGGAAVASTYELHIVRSKAGFVVVPKETDGLKDVYADVREWDVEEWRDHPELIEALVANGHQDLVKQSTTQEVIKNLIDFGNASTNKREVSRE